jgi:hypothetical protein
MNNYFYKIFVLIPIFSILNFLILINNSDAQWVQTNGIYGSTIFSLAVSGNNIFAGTSQYGVYISTNSGSSWVQTALNNRNVRSFAVNGNNIFAGTDEYGVYLSTNNGSSWTQTALYYTTVWSLAISGNNIFAGTDNGVYLSTNNGSTWTQTALTETIVSSLAINGNNIFAGTWDGAYLSTNNGSSWIQIGLYDKDVYSFAVSGNNIFAGTDNGVYLSTNNGSSWTQTGFNNQYIYSLAVNGNYIFAGTQNYPSGSCGVYLSTNNGSSWIQKNEGFNVIPTISALLIANNYIFAGTYEQSVWRRLYSEIINSMQDISTGVPSAFSLEQNYPNPFNPITKIRFDLPKNVNVKLTIYDMLGREVETIVNEHLNAGSYEVTFDGTKYTSGVYYYRLNAGEFVETKKMILLK